MLGVGALLLTVYAAYVAWPWWIAALIGATVGALYFVMVTMPRTMPTAAGMATAAAWAIAIFGAYTVGIYFVARWAFTLVR